MNSMTDDINKPKRPRGRPRSGELPKVVLTVKADRKEIERWRTLAKEEGVSMTAFILEPLRRSLKRKGKA